VRDGGAKTWLRRDPVALSLRACGWGGGVVMMTKTWRAILVVVAAAGWLLPSSVKAQPEVTARGAIIVDADTGAVIWEQNADQPLPPASTTKVMTAVLALQSHQLDERFTVSANAAATGGSRMGLRPGQTIALRDLLFAVLLKSANDAAVVVAEGVAGSEVGFADRMNLKARVIGANTTNFENPHGLTSYGHVTSARDLSRMFRYGLGVPGFREVLYTPSADIDIEGPNAHLATVRSHNRLLNAPDYQVIGKTGYTGPARRCFVGAAGYGRHEVVIAILGSTDLWGDARRMLSYGLSRPTPVLMAASATPPPPAATDVEEAPPPATARAAEIEEAPPPATARAAVEEPEQAPSAAPQPALDRAARMARARTLEPEADDEAVGGTAGGTADREEARPVVVPPPVEDRPVQRPPTREELRHRDFARDPRNETAEPVRMRTAPVVEEEGEAPVPAAATEPAPARRTEVVEPEVHPRTEIIVPAASERPTDVEPPPRPRDEQPGARNEPAQGDERAPGRSVWADSPLRGPNDPPRGRATGMAAPGLQHAVARELAPSVETPPSRRSERSAREERATAVAARGIADPRKRADADAEKTGRTPGRTNSNARALTRDERPDTASIREAKNGRRDVATLRASRREAEAARDERRNAMTGRDDRRRPGSLARASSADDQAIRGSSRSLDRERGKMARNGRGRRTGDQDVATDVPPPGKFTVQIGPYRDRKAVAMARADLAKRGYETRVVGQKLEVVNLEERRRADKVVSRLRVSGHRATIAEAKKR